MTYVVPVSHGEGRFFARTSEIENLFAHDQVATQYVDDRGLPSMDTAYNPNGSVMAIEGILSPDGRVFGKMGHTERAGEWIAKNIPGDKDPGIFLSGVRYFQ
jgi:phosphoribosylformylglycinamidine synthase